MKSQTMDGSRYFDNAATSFPKPPGVAREMARYLNELGGPYGRSAYPRALEVARTVERARDHLAGILGTSHCERVMFMPNATTSINTVLKGFRLDGGCVWISPLEHNAVMRPLTAMQKRQSFAIKTLPYLPDGTVDIQRISAERPPDLRLIIVNHVSNVNGVVQPLAAKYGLAVTGTVHPDKVISNDKAQPGDPLILTKPLGTGVLVAGWRVGQARPEDYQRALDSMKQLNRRGAEIMQEFEVRAATDITGFGLLGHAMHIANASRVTLRIEAEKVPVLPGAADLLAMGCILGGAFRNLTYVEKFTRFFPGLSYEHKMLLLDPQTSGGLLMCPPLDRIEPVLKALHQAGYTHSSLIGMAMPRTILLPKNWTRV